MVRSTALFPQLEKNKKASCHKLLNYTNRGKALNPFVDRRLWLFPGYFVLHKRGKNVSQDIIMQTEQDNSFH